MRLKAVLLTVLSTCIAVCSLPVFAQASPTHFGRTAGNGYFSNSYTGGSGSPLFPTPLTISGATEVDKVNDFIATLTSHLGTEPEATSFIIFTMLDRPYPTSYTPATAADITELKNRLMTFVSASSGGKIIDNPAYPFSVATYYQPSVSDVAWYSLAGGSTMPAYTFSKGGIDYYIIGKSYANPLANPPSNDFNGIPAVATGWTISGRSSVDKPFAYPGETINFYHYVKNNGPDDTSPTKVNFRVNNTITAGYFGGGSKTFIAGSEDQVNTNAVPIPVGTAAGTKFCQRVQWNPASSATVGSPTWNNGSTVCVTVQTGYKIQPYAESSQSSVLPGDDFKFTLYAKNTGISKSDRPVQIYKRNIVVPSNVLPSGSWFSEKTGNITCGTYTTGYAGITCSETKLVNPDQVILASEQLPLPSAEETITANAPGWTPGTRICRVVSVTPYDQTSPVGERRDSAPSCVTIAKSPYMALVGGDSSAGGSFYQPCINSANSPSDPNYPFMEGFIASRYNSTANKFGSYSDYALFAVGPIINYGSTGWVHDAFYTRLSFANTGITLSADYRSEQGYYYTDRKHCIENYVEQYREKGESGTLNAATVDWTASGTYYYDPSVSDRVDLTGDHVLAENQDILVYAPTRTVHIAGNITYTANPLSSFGNAPRLVIIAKNVEISGAVGRYDGVIFTTNDFNTCSEAGNNPNDLQDDHKTAITLNGACRNQLIINGAVIAFNAILPRTYGGTQPGQPAEVFRLRPEVFLKPYVESTNNQYMTTDSETELPPRY